MFEWLGPLGSFLGGAGQFAGGLSGIFSRGGGQYDNSTFYQNWRNADMAWSREQFDRTEALQREFAQNGIRWRVEDAKAAGLHPLAAIGAAGASYSPVVTAGGGQYQVDQGRPDRGGDIGSSLANMGQGLGRAMLATQTPQERVETATEMIHNAQRTEMNDKQLKMMDIDLLYKAAQYAKFTQQQGPGMPPSVGPWGKNMSGGGGAPSNESQGVDPRPGHTATVEGMGTGYIDPYGGATTLPQKDINIDEISSPGWSSFMYTNRILPLIHHIQNQAFGAGKPEPTKPPDKALPPGATSWHFAFPGRWIPVYPKGPSSRRGHMSEPGYQYHGSY